MSVARTLLPSCVLLLLLLASISTTIVILSSSIRSLRTDTQQNISKLYDHLTALESNQEAFSAEIQTLTSLVVNSLNATDEYINNITQSVTEAKATIHQNVQTVNELADSQNSLLAVQFAGMFTVLVILVSGYHLSQHVRHFHSPVVQRKIMAVLWMTPVYAVTSWLSLLFPLSEPYLSVIRDFYESYCVYTFLSFLIAVLGRGDRWAVVSLLERGAEGLSDPDKLGCPRWCWRCCESKKRQIVPPSSPGRINNDDGENGTVATWMSSSTEVMQQQQPTHHLNSTADPNKNRHKAEAVLDQCQTYAMQFVLLRPIMAIAWLVSNQFVQPESFLDWKSPQMYIVIITNVSIFFAFRGVVFMTFWQKMTLSIIVHLAYPDRFSSNEEATDFVARSQNFLICLEMLFAAVAHCFVFPPEEWAEGYREREESKRKRQSEFESHFGDSVALGDFIKDVRAVMASKRRRRLRKRKNRNKASLGPHETVIEEEEEEDGGDREGGMPRPQIPTSSVARNRIDSSESYDDEFDPQFSIDDDDDDEIELSSPTSLNVARKSKLPPHSSCSSLGSSDRDYQGSWARIEQYINEHGSSNSSGEGKRATSIEKDLSKKEIV
ncbi:hypothetical protein ACHAWX_002099 [Stephanocyclus meneghinianus]